MATITTKIKSKMTTEEIRDLIKKSKDSYRLSGLPTSFYDELLELIEQVEALTEERDKALTALANMEGERDQAERMLEACRKERAEIVHENRRLKVPWGPGERKARFEQDMAKSDEYRREMLEEARKQTRLLEGISVRLYGR